MFVPVTATSSCMSNQKSDGCSPAIFRQDAGVDVALMDTQKYDTELMLPLPRLHLSGPTFNAAALQMIKEEEDKGGLNVLVYAAMRVTKENEKQKAYTQERVQKWRIDKQF